MHQRLSVYIKDNGVGLVKHLPAGYRKLLVVIDKLEVVGIVSEEHVLDALKEKRTIHEFRLSRSWDAEMVYGVCRTPLTISPDASIDDIEDTFYKERVPI